MKQSNIKLLLLTFFVIVVVSILTVVLNQKSNAYVEGDSVEIDSLVLKAKVLYEKAKSEGMDFSNGPCLSDYLEFGWVVDIVHEPRTPEDDLHKNMCISYVERRATHMIELDTEGNVISVK